MKEQGPIEQLEALDAAVQAANVAPPSVSAILARRLHDLIPQLPAELPAAAVMIGGQSLVQRLEQRLTSGKALALAGDAALGYWHEQRHHGIAQRHLPGLERLIEQLGARPTAWFGDYLKRHWRLQRIDGQPMSQWFRARMVERLQAQQRLREQDGTLGAAHSAMLEHLVRMPDALSRLALPAFRRPGVYAVRLSAPAQRWSIELPGAFVVTQRDARGFHDAAGAFTVPPPGNLGSASPEADAGPVTLNTPALGIECFASLAELHEELSARFDDERQAEALLAVLGHDDRRRVLQAEHLELPALHDDVFSRSAGQLNQWQYRQLEKLPPSSTHGTTLEALDKSLLNAVDVTQVFNRQAILRNRYSALLEKHLPGWMKKASAQQKIEIMQSLQELASELALSLSPGMPSMQQFGERTYMLRYARQQLRQRLRADLDLDIDPDLITLSVTRAEQTGPIPPPTNPLSSIPGRSRQQAGHPVTLSTQRYKLSELALENVALIDTDYTLTARVQGPPGLPLPGLTTQYVRSAIRHLNVGDRYSRFVETRLLQGPDAQWRQERYRRITLARMRAEAIKARYAGHFLTDRGERGYQWAAALLDHPNRGAGRKTVEGHTLEIHQLLINGATVRGVCVIASTSPQSLPNQVYYTPDAPDRRAWREYRDGQGWLAAIRADTALRDYIVDRVALTDRQRVLSHLNGKGAARYFTTQIITGDFIDQCYHADVRQVLSNIDGQSTSTAEMNLSNFWQFTVLMAEVASLALPGKVLLPLALARAFWSLWEGVDSIAQGQRDEGLRLIMESISHLTDAASIALGSTYLARTMRKLPVKRPMSLNTNLAITQEPANLRFRIDSHYREGVYEKVSDTGGPSEYYMKDKDGRTYQVLFDGEKWHVVDARNPDAIFHPLVQRNAQGELEVVRSVHWLGKAPNLPRLFDDYQRGDVPLPRLVLDARGLAWWQGDRYLVIDTFVLAVRKSLRGDRFTLLPPSPPAGQSATVFLRYDAGWEIKVKQAGVISAWLPVPRSSTLADI